MSELESKRYIEAGTDASPEAALEFADSVAAKIVDLKFTDLLGTWQHVSRSMSSFSSDDFDEGLGFDGSSIRGWQGIAESDMLLVPDASTAILDPFTAEPTLSLLCEVRDPITGEGYNKDPRALARRAEQYLVSTGVADTCYVGPECEFFVFDSVRYRNDTNASGYEVESGEGYWNSNREGSTGYTIREKHGYFPVAPHDTLQDLRTEMVLEMEKLGITCEFHHHEVATADQIMLYKYVVRNVARRHGKSVTFMPKPIFGDNGSGMHTHQSLWKEGTPLFADKSGYAGLSQLARAYIGGLLKHAPALLAFCAPTTNSYRRLVPGYEAPVNLVYSQRNRSACIRIPMYSSSPKATRLEFRCPDAMANPYLAFSAMLMAGLDGIEKGLDAGEPADFDLFEEANDIPQVPGSLAESLNALEDDHDFLLKGGVFSEDLIQTWIAWKRENEVDHVNLRPHPAEFGLYYDA
jgi:glutamine synthetase